GLAAQPAFGAYLTRHARHLTCESVQLVDHGVDRVLELEDLAPDVHRDLLRQVALLDRGGDLGNVADLAGQVAGHEVHVFSQVLPHPTNALDVGLTAELAFGADLACNAGHLFGKRVQLVDHRVDGLLELEDLSSDVAADLLQQVALRESRRDLGDAADLAGRVAA